MYRFFIYPLLVLSSLFIQAQDQSLIPKTDTLQKLNIEWFNEYEGKNGGIVYLEDSTKIELVWQKNSYREDITKKGSPYTLTVLYDKETGEYRGGGIRFYGIRIGDWKGFHEGLQKWVTYQDESKNFPFSYEQLLAKMKREYNLDLEKEYARREYIDVRRGTEDKFGNEGGHCSYVVIYTLTEEELKNYHPTGYDYISTEPREYYYSKIRRRLYINGQTGEVEVDIITNYDQYASNYYQRWIEGEKFPPVKKRKL